MKSFRLVLSIAVLLAAPALAQVIEPGVDLFETPAGSGSGIDFGGDPIPEDFFCSGSPEFAGTIALKGKPLATEPPQVAGSTDCIVERLEPVEANGGTTMIEIRALKLKHEQKLVIDCDTGPTEFGVWVTLDPATPPSGASVMQVYEDSFTSYLEVPAVASFYRIDDGTQLPPVFHRADFVGSGFWSANPGTGAITIPDPFEVDTDGDNVPDTLVPGTSNNFNVGWQDQGRRATREAEKWARHFPWPPWPWPWPIPVPIPGEPVPTDPVEPVPVEPIQIGVQ